MGKAIRKIVTVGDSLGVTLPKHQLTKQKIKQGDDIEITYKRV